VVTAPAILGYDSGKYQKGMVITSNYGTDECARKDVLTGAIDSTKKGEDRSGLCMPVAAYQNVTFGTVAGSNSGYAMTCNGTDSRVAYSQTDSNDSLLKKGSQFVIEARVIMTTLPSVKTYANAICGNHINGTGDTGCYFQVDTSNRLAFGAIGLTATVSNQTLSTGTWYKLKVTGDGSTIKLYIDDVECTYVTQNVSAYDIALSGGNFEVGNFPNQSVYGWAGSIEYFKLARGTTTLSAVGYYSQPPMVSPVLMGSAGFAAEVHSGQNGATTVNFDTIGFGQYGVNLSMKDCYDQYLRYKKNFATSGKNMHLKVTMNRGTAENISSIPGLDFKFDK
jgi:hypothetical protein